MAKLAESVVEEIANRWSGRTDGPEGAVPLAQWFVAAAESVAGGEAALEIGVREGGTSAMFCELLARMDLSDRQVLSVDPYGEMPMWSPNLVGRYGEDIYAAAKETLKGFGNSAFFKLTDEAFLHHVLPVHRWWSGGREHPGSPRFLFFAFLDGPHENTAVIEEVLAVLRHTAVGGYIAVDNTEHTREAIAMLTASPRLGLELRETWLGKGNGVNRALLVATR